jgi:hypothetical protein
VLGDVYTDVEKTVIALQRRTIVQETRSAFQTALQHKFITAVERLSGREVLTFISNHHVGPDMEIELFVLKPPDGEPAVRPPASAWLVPLCATSWIPGPAILAMSGVSLYAALRRANPGGRG